MAMALDKSDSTFMFGDMVIIVSEMAVYFTEDLARRRR
jgi:hypothetical protein